MSAFTTYLVSFGSPKTGLATVGYQIKGAAGANIGARITAGVYEVGGGCYGVDVVLPNASKGILWDTGEAVPRFACEDFLSDFINQRLTNRRFTNPTTGVQTIFERDDAATLIQGDLFEDIAGTTPYSATSTGIDRTDRMA